MRTLGTTLILAALALGAGGVSVRDASADEQTPALTEYPEAVVGNSAKDKLQPKNACKVDKPAAPAAVRIPLKAFNAQNYVHLNTRGYNYARPDDPPERYVPSIPSSAQSQR